MFHHDATEVAYRNGFEAGTESATKRIFEEIDDILDRCAHDNGEMIVRALTELKQSYEVCKV